VKSARVSVIIPTFNRAHLIGRALNSVLPQCREGDEVIVVDDGSTDGTEQVLAGYGNRIQYIRIHNSGAGSARNRGLDAAGNELVAFLDSDDEWMPGKLELQRSLLDARDDVLYCFSNFAVRDRYKNVTRRYLIHWHRDKRSWDEILAPGIRFSQIAPLPPGIEDFMVHVGDMYYAMAAAGYIFTGTVVVRREEAKEALRFAEDIPTYEDWVCFGRLAGKGMGAYLDCETAWQHGHTGERLTDADSYKCATTRLTVLERVWGSDKDFLAQHAEYYQQIVEQQYIIRAAGMISRGDTSKARAELAKVKKPPLTHRLLAILPGVLARALVAGRRFVIRLLTGR